MPSNEDGFHARFYVNPAGVTMGANDVLSMFQGGQGASTPAFTVQLQEPTSSSYKVRAGLIDTSSAWHYSDWYPVTSGWNAVEVDYEVGTSGSLTLYINGT